MQGMKDDVLQRGYFKDKYKQMGYRGALPDAFGSLMGMMAQNDPLNREGYMPNFYSYAARASMAPTIGAMAGNPMFDKNWYNPMASMKNTWSLLGG